MKLRIERQSGLDDRSSGFRSLVRMLRYVYIIVCLYVMLLN